jgi:hypothetical protein
MKDSGFVSRAYITIAILAAAMFYFAIRADRACGQELLRDGPVQIERQKDDRFAYPSPSSHVIVRVDKSGDILRRGIKIESVHREDLLLIIRELMALELLKSMAPRGR